MTERDAKGRYLPGSSGNPGGRGRRYKEYIQWFNDEMNEADFKAIVNKAVEQAIGGDRFARDFVASYTLGKPVDVTILLSEDSEKMSIKDWLKMARERLEE